MLCGIAYGVLHYPGPPGIGWKIFLFVVGLLVAAMAIGFIAIGIFEESRHWNFVDGRCTLTSSNLFSARSLILTPDDIEKLDIVTVDGGPEYKDTHHAVIVLKSGERYKLPDFDTREGACGLAQRIESFMSIGPRRSDHPV